MTFVRLFVAASLVAALAACGGGSSGSSSPSAGNVLSGVVSKGPVNNSSVCAYSVTGATKGTALGRCVATNTNGTFSLDIGSYSGPVLLESSGGSYVDEATGGRVTLATPLRSVLGSVTGATTVAVTPLTELAHGLASGATGGLTAANIAAAVETVQNNFGVFDIMHTLPADALNVAANSTVSQRTYALALALVSQYLANKPAGSKLADALLEMKTCLASPASGCGAGGSDLGTLLAAAAQGFTATHTDFSDINLPVNSFGSVSTPPGNKSVAVSMFAAVAFDVCPNGGITVMSGIDTNGNGRLDDAEGTNSQQVCYGLDGANGSNGTNGTNGTNGSNGQNGTNGLTALVVVASEPAGLNCTAGGTKVSAGLDTNTNSVLNVAEVTSTSYVCGGTTGATGAAGATGSTGSTGATGATGAAGTSALFTVTPEAAGGNCPYGGSRLASGADTNANGVLDSGEVSSQGYVCNGAAAGAATVSGRVADGYIIGARVTLDLNDDRICDAAEPNTTTNGSGGYVFDTTLGQHMLCASGGVDMASLLPFRGELRAPAGATLITPLTTLVMTKVNGAMPTPVSGIPSPALKTAVDTANTALAAALGLPGVDLLTADPIAVAATSPQLTRITTAVEVLLEQLSTAVSVASGGSGYDGALYRPALSATVDALATLGVSAPIDFANVASVRQLVDAAVAGTVVNSGRSLKASSVAALTGDLISATVRAVANGSTSALATTGGAVEMSQAVRQYTNSLVNVVQANRFSLVPQSSAFACTQTCLNLAGLQAVGASAATLLNNAVPNANALEIKLPTILVNDQALKAPTANTALRSITISGALTKVSMQLGGTPAAARGSANVTISRDDGRQLQMVIDQVDVATAVGVPKVTVPATARMLVYFGQGNSYRPDLKATFSSVSSLLSTDANGVATIDMGALLNLVKSIEPDRLYFNTTGNFKVGFGIQGVPVAVSTELGATLPVIENSSYTDYGSHLALGADFFVESVSTPVPTTPAALPATTLQLNLTTLAFNNTAVTAPNPYTYYGEVGLQGNPLTTISLQAAGTPDSVLAQGTVTIYQSSPRYRYLNLRFDQIQVATVSGKPVLSIPAAAKLYVSSHVGSATISNVSSLLTTNANGVINLNMGGLNTLLSSLFPNATAFADPGGLYTVGFSLTGVPLAITDARSTTVSSYGSVGVIVK